jgi:hypothetical protein
MVSEALCFPLRSILKDAHRDNCTVRYTLKDLLAALHNSDTHATLQYRTPCVLRVIAGNDN